MASWTALLNALFLPGKPILGSTGVALRDNLQAYAERDASVPANLQPYYLLGTVATTSGTSVTLSSLDLTSYRELRIILNGISCNSGSNQAISLGGATIGLAGLGSTQTYGVTILDLATGVVQNATGNGALSTITNASTSLVFSVAGGASYDAGQIKVYGIK